MATAQIPQLKKSLETLIFSVQSLVQSHGVVQGYSTGVLKNRALDGSVQQEMIISDSSEEESDAEEEE